MLANTKQPVEDAFSSSSTSQPMTVFLLCKIRTWLFGQFRCRFPRCSLQSALQLCSYISRFANFRRVCNTVSLQPLYPRCRMLFVNHLRVDERLSVEALLRIIENVPRIASSALPGEYRNSAEQAQLRPVVESCHTLLEEHMSQLSSEQRAELLSTHKIFLYDTWSLLRPHPSLLLPDDPFLVGVFRRSSGRFTVSHRTLPLLHASCPALSRSVQVSVLDVDENERCVDVQSTLLYRRALAWILAQLVGVDGPPSSRQLEQGHWLHLLQLIRGLRVVRLGSCTTFSVRYSIRGLEPPLCGVRRAVDYVWDSETRCVVLGASSRLDLNVYLLQELTGCLIPASRFVLAREHWQPILQKQLLAAVDEAPDADSLTAFVRDTTVCTLLASRTHGHFPSAPRYALQASRQDQGGASAPLAAIVAIPAVYSASGPSPPSGACPTTAASSRSRYEGRHSHYGG
jgi:hypothetical protein